MEIFGGFMVMMCIIGFFMAMLWMIMPLLIFVVKGKQEKTLELMTAMDKRLAQIESRLKRIESNAQYAEVTVNPVPLDLHIPDGPDSTQDSESQSI